MAINGVAFSPPSATTTITMPRFSLLIRTLIHSWLLFALSSPAFATQERIMPKAGLWQVNSQTLWFDRVVPDVGKMIHMGPKKLQNHINNMLQQNHVRLNGDGTAAVCVSEQQITSNNYVNDNGSGCAVSKGKRIGNVLFFQTQCEAPSGFGVTTVRLVDSQHWEATSQFIVTIRSIAQNIDNKSYGTWQSANCPAGL